MYTAADDVRNIIAKRRRDQGLFRAVAEFLDGPPPDGWPLDCAIATLNRYLATARIEDVVFAHAAKSIGLRPYWPTYLAERFTSHNPEKVSCARPRIQRQKFQVTKQWLINDPAIVSNQPLGSLLVGNTRLPDVHQAARRLVLDADIVDNIFDVSSWNRRQAIRFGALPGKPLAAYYYQPVMALYLYHGVLFEDFDGGPNENSGLAEFVSSIVRPAFDAVTKQFGLRPLIVRLPFCPGFLDFPAVTAPAFDQYRAA